MKQPKKGSPAELMLRILESAHPDGVPTVEIARQIFGSGSWEDRIRVARLARSLRKCGYRVYSIGGVYSLCTPEKLDLVGRRMERMSCGYLLGAASAAQGIAESGDSARAEILRRELKRAVARTLKAI